MDRFWREVHAITWALAAIGIGLIVLSKGTAKLGIFVTLVGVAVHFAATAGERSNTDE